MDYAKFGHVTDVDLIGVEEAAKILCLNPRTIRHRIAARTLAPAMKLPGKTGAHLFHRADVEALAAERAEKTA